MSTRFYGKLALENGKWVMSDTQPNTNIRLKQIFPRIEKTRVAPFTFPHNDMHCADLRWFLERYPMAMSLEDRERLHGGADSYRRTQEEMELIVSGAHQPMTRQGFRPGCEGRPHQTMAAELVLRRKGLLLGDDIGLGKTVTAFLMALEGDTRPCAVVVQTHLQAQWLRMLLKFTYLAGYKVKGTQPDKEKLPAADVYIFKYSQLAGWVDVFATGIFRSVIFDEIQELRHGTATDKGKAAKVLSYNAEYRLGLSATPIFNYGDEIWNIMQFIDPDVLGTFWEFNNEWMDRATKGVKDPVALGAFLRDQHVFLRRTKADVGQMWYSPDNPWIEWVEFDDGQMRSVEHEAMALALRTLNGSFVERGQAGRELDMMVRHATGVGKARAVAAFARVFLENGVPIVMAGWHRDVYEIWLRELAQFKPAMYTGSESPKQKEEAKNDFLAGRTDLLIMSLRSGAGLDGLQYRCSTMLIGEIDFSKEIHKQLIGRLDREGQKDPLTVVYCVTDNGSDPPIMDVIALKAQQSTGIVDLDQVFAMQPMDESRIRKLAEQYVQKKKGAMQLALVD